MPARYAALLGLLALTLALPAAAPEAPGLLSATTQLLSACVDDYNRLDFERSEAEAREAMRLQPEHPLPVVHWQGCLVARAFEQQKDGGIQGDLLDRFQQASEQAEALEAAWEQAHPDGWSQLYQGNSLGARGLIQIYQGNYLRAYRLGRRANLCLIEAQRRQPGLPDADLGLGQYQYYCGKLSGVLQFFLALPADIPGGIARLKACAASGCRSSVLAKLVLARILTDERPDAEAALPYVQEAYRRYPNNWACAKAALQEAQLLGPGRAEARELTQALQRQWSSGWRPPAYAPMGPP
jgi:tetratricopeptide (TPR) repeat protein